MFLCFFWVHIYPSAVHNGVLVLVSNNTIIARDTQTGAQRFFLGHTADVCAVAFSAYAQVSRQSERSFMSHPRVRITNATNVISWYSIISEVLLTIQLNDNREH